MTTLKDECREWLVRNIIGTSDDDVISLHSFVLSHLRQFAEEVEVGKMIHGMGATEGDKRGWNSCVNVQSAKIKAALKKREG